jgi:DNA repair protein RadD
MCGRGLRTHPGKSDCLILDFGENLKRHGPIDAIDFNRKKAQKQLEKGDGQGPGKQCPGCQAMVAANTRVCECGFIFPVNTYQADTESQLLVAPQKWEVIESKASLHKKKNAEEGAPPTLRIDYICQRWGEEFGNLTDRQISEWICLEHDGFAGRKADHWWHTHSRAERPLTVMEGLQLWLAGAVACPTSITTIREGKFDKILSREIDEVPERWRGSEIREPRLRQQDDGPSLASVNALAGNEEEPPF